MSPNTDEHGRLNPSHAGWYSVYLPQTAQGMKVQVDFGSWLYANIVSPAVAHSS